MPMTMNSGVLSWMYSKYGIASDGSLSIGPSRPTRANVSSPLAAVGASREMICWSAK